ncbi:MAG: DUF3857 and transglutaminase domain-containing protein [Salinivirgaceae bacterium]
MKYLVLIIALFGTVIVKAENIDDAIQHKNLQEAYKGHHQVLVFDSTEADVQESGLSYVVRKQLFYALDKQGAADLHQVTYNYDPLSAFVEIKKAIIIRKDGTREKLDSTHVYDFPQPARMIYWGARQKMVEVGSLNPGDALYVEVFRKGFTYALLQSGGDDEQYIPPMRGHYYDIVKFQEPFPIHRKVFETHIPKSKEVQYQTFNANFVVKESEGDKQTFYFQLDSIFPVKREPNMVGLDNVIPKVLITTSPDWEAKSKWFYGVNEDFGSFESTPEIDEKVNEILSGAKSELDSITLLNQWVSDEIRYSGISMGEGEGYTLHTGDMTFTDRAGVCKDKAGMLITMLRAAGFESYAAMTMAGSRIEDIPADQFNHSVTVVKRRSGEYQLLDPTWVPFVRELWSSREQQQNYLMGLPDGADLMITDVSAPENHYLKINNQSKLNNNGTLTGTLTINAEGQSDATVRSLFTRDYKSQWDDNVKKQLLRIYPQAIIEDISYTDPYAYRDHPVTITYKYTIPGFAIVDGDTFIFNSFTNSGFMQYFRFGQSLDKSIDERQYDYRIGCSQWVQIEEEFEMPAKVKRIDTENYSDVNNEPASASVSWSDDKNLVTMELESTFNKRIYKAETWPQMKEVLDVLHSFQNQPIIVITK